MRETKIFQTDLHAYQVTKLAADPEGIEALLRAQKLAVKISGGMETLVADMSKEDLSYFCTLFAKYTKVIQGDKKPILSSIFAVHFGGEWFEIIKWLAFCLGYNFGPFFLHMVKDGKQVRDAAVEGAGLPQGEPSENIEPAESTGTSGES